MSRLGGGHVMGHGAWDGAWGGQGAGYAFEGPDEVL
jgi:hypothetical protein